MPLHPPTIAALEEARIARGLSEVAPEHRTIRGQGTGPDAVAGRDSPGSWFNAVVNLGMNGPIDEADLRSVIDWYAEAGVQPTIELCPYAHPSTPAACSRAGFILNPATEGPDGVSCAFEHVLALGIDPTNPVRPERPPMDGDRLALRAIDPTDAGLARSFAEVCVARSSPTAPRPNEHEYAAVQKCLDHPRTIGMAAFIDGRMVGAGMIEVTGELCALFSAKVLPDFRRRGIQQALIAARLNLAAARGARIATIGSRPGIATERNVRRMGFEVIYTKAILIRPGEGLKGIGQ